MEKLPIDSSTLISLASNCLLWVLARLKEKSKVEFYLPQSVRVETIDSALKSRKWHLEGLRIINTIDKGVLSTAANPEIKQLLDKILQLSNSIYSAKGSNIKIIHLGEAEVIAMAKNFKSKAIIIDEKTTRLLIENPIKLRDLQASKLHTRVTINEGALRQFKELIGNLSALRSVELCCIAFEKGIFDFMAKSSVEKKSLLSALLWALKLSGCAISVSEINGYLKYYFP